MSEQINEQEKQLTETPENQIAENAIPEIKKTPDNREKIKNLLANNCYCACYPDSVEIRKS